MRTLEEVRLEILGYYHETDLSIEDAVQKAGPFDDFDPESTSTLVSIGLLRSVGDDIKWLRLHPVEEKGRDARSYLGRFQLRPSQSATAAGVYPHLTIRFDVGGKNRRLLEFTRDDINHLRNAYVSQAVGLTRRVFFLDWLDDQFKSRARNQVSALPKHVLEEADKRAGEAFR